MSHHAHADHAAPDPHLVALLRHAVAVGVVLVALLPAARGTSALLGWLPLWLVGMPLIALWALHRFPLPRRARDEALQVQPRRKRRVAQARRRARAVVARHAQAA